MSLVGPMVRILVDQRQSCDRRATVCHQRAQNYRSALTLSAPKRTNRMSLDDLDLARQIGTSGAPATDRRLCTSLRSWVRVLARRSMRVRDPCVEGTPRGRGRR